MKQLQTIVGSFLDKVDSLLTTEPVRVILYSAAVVVFLVARFLTDRGILALPLTFAQSVQAAGGAIVTVVILVESLRRFVYSPQTYIEDISDESKAAHEAAHLEESFKATLDAIQAAQTAPKKTRVAIGSVKAAGSTDQSN